MNEFAIKKALEHFNINVEEFMSVYNKHNYSPFSVEEFLFTDYDFVSESMPDKVIKYVKENNLDIDTVLLESYLLARKKYWELDDIICDISYGYDCGYDDDQEELNRLLLEQDELYELCNLIPIELLKIKQLIQ